MVQNSRRKLALSHNAIHMMWIWMRIADQHYCDANGVFDDGSFVNAKRMARKSQLTRSKRVMSHIHNTHTLF